MYKDKLLHLCTFIGVSLVAFGASYVFYVIIVMYELFW